MIPVCKPSDVCHWACTPVCRYGCTSRPDSGWQTYVRKGCHGSPPRLVHGNPSTAVQTQWQMSLGLHVRIRLFCCQAQISICPLTFKLSIRSWQLMRMPQQLQGRWLKPGARQSPRSWTWMWKPCLWRRCHTPLALKATWHRSSYPDCFLGPWVCLEMEFKCMRVTWHDNEHDMANMNMSQHDKHEYVTTWQTWKWHDMTNMNMTWHGKHEYVTTWQTWW